jgi:hypothetical protein
VVGRLLVACGAAALLAGGALAAYDLARGGGDGGPGAAPVAAALDARLREARAAVNERARTLTEMPLLAHAVATDEATVRDLTGKEIGFRPRAGEALEIAQIDVATKRVATLLRLPAESPTSPFLETPGDHAAINGGVLYLSDVRDVIPSDPGRAREVHGALAVTTQVELSPVLEALGGGSARLELGGAIIALGPVGATDRAVTTVDIPSVAGLKLHVVTPAGVASGGSPLRGASLAAAGLLVLALGLGVAFAQRRRTPAIPVSARETLPPSNDPLAAPVGTPPPRDFGRYQRVKLLGSGGMADVYLARSTGEAGFERPVALKVLHSHMARRQQAVNHFLDEARLASRLDHPSIVTVLDLGLAGDEYFIAMEYIDGADLDRVLRSMRERSAFVPLAVALTILRRVCDGLHAAHTATGDDGIPLGLIHRDVKTANVLLSRQGAVKIGDFGIARAASTVRTTTIGETKGTAEVMSPEQRMGHEIDVRADVYSCGALGYELLTGAAVNLDLAILAQFGVEGWPHLPPATELRPDLPAELDDILKGALAYLPAGRPDSCAALEEKLAAVARRYGLVCGDKEIAAWLAGELPRLAIEPPVASIPVPTLARL